MKTKDMQGLQSSNGSMCLSVTGGEASWICGDYSQFFNNYVSYSPFGTTEESHLFDFYRTGRLPDSNAGCSASGILCMTDDEIDALPSCEIDRLLGELKKYAFVMSLWNRIHGIDKSFLESRESRLLFLKSIKDILDLFDGENGRGNTWGDGALCSSLTLAPLEEKEVCFTLSWHFPNHYSEKGSALGHMYENWFKDATEVNAEMTGNYSFIKGKTLAFSQAMYDTNLDPVLPDAWSGHLSTLVKSTWWLKNGDFAVWEGLGCCGFHTTDITYQGSFNILALFPELQMRQMEMGARFQREDGRVHHSFSPGLSAVDDGFDRVDMNPQYILLVCRDFLWTGDRDYIKRLWPSVVKSVKSMEKIVEPRLHQKQLKNYGLILP